MVMIQHSYTVIALFGANVNGNPKRLSQIDLIVI